MSRDLSLFYSQGMNIQSRSEVLSTGEQTPWSANPALTQIVEYERTNYIVKSKLKNGDLYYYGTLKFQCTFPTIDNYSDIEFSFAYAVPYVYS
jgi:hypothetical protein